MKLNFFVPETGMKEYFKLVEQGNLLPDIPFHGIGSCIAATNYVQGTVLLFPLKKLKDFKARLFDPT